MRRRVALLVPLAALAIYACPALAQDSAGPSLGLDTSAQAIGQGLLADAGAGSREELFGVPALGSTGQPKRASLAWHGHVEDYTAYDYLSPAHWSRGVVRTEFGTEGGASGLGGGLKWKATFRVDADPVYATSNFYPEAVRNDQKLNFYLRETYIDTTAGNFDFRLGKQDIVWGDVVGLFFADVVSAKDLRDFILPDFQTIRIPQWAARAEYFGKNSTFELVWLPYPSVDDIGKPGSDFYPFKVPPPPGFTEHFNSEVFPTHDLRNSNYGARVSTLRNGWDLSGFYYRSTDVSPTFYREVTLSPTPTVIYTPRHDRIWQVGGTASKAYESFVAKAEAVYTSGRSFNVTRLSQSNGVVPQDTLDYIVGLDFTLPRETRLDMQYFERDFFNHDPDLLFDKHERGVSLLLSGKVGALRPELFVAQSLNRAEGMVRASLGWIPATNWRLTAGVVTFSGPAFGFFGRYSGDDRVYVDARHDF